jgi:hypothetical protein
MNESTSKPYIFMPLSALNFCIANAPLVLKYHYNLSIMSLQHLLFLVIYNCNTNIYK